MWWFLIECLQCHDRQTVSRVILRVWESAVTPPVNTSARGGGRRGVR